MVYLNFIVRKSLKILYQHEPDDPEQHETDDCEHDPEIGNRGLFLPGFFPRIPGRTARCRDPAAPAVTHANRGPGFLVPAHNARAVVVGREPAVSAELSPAVLAGERECGLAAAVVATRHRSSRCLFLY